VLVPWIDRHSVKDAVIVTCAKAAAACALLGHGGERNAAFLPQTEEIVATKLRLTNGSSGNAPKIAAGFLAGGQPSLPHRFVGF
jgi:hypothetical protein